MTKEELKKEAEEYRKNLKEELLNDDEFERLSMFDPNVEQAYLAGAEPREKRIAELERNVAYYAERAKYAELDGRDYVLKYKDLGKRCLQLQKDKGNLTDKVRELEQQIEKMKCCENCKHHYIALDDTTSCELLDCLAGSKPCDKWEIRR